MSGSGSTSSAMLKCSRRLQMAIICFDSKATHERPAERQEYACRVHISSSTGYDFTSAIQVADCSLVDGAGWQAFSWNAIGCCTLLYSRSRPPISSAWPSLLDRMAKGMQGKLPMAAVG